MIHGPQTGFQFVRLILHEEEEHKEEFAFTLLHSCLLVLYTTTACR